MREIRHERYYRLLVKVPLTVSFPSVVYRLDIEAVTGAPVWELRAESLAGDPNWSICHRGTTRQLVEDAVYDEGFDLLWPTAPALIMERMCAEGRAERLSCIDDERARANGEKRNREFARSRKAAREAVHPPR